MVYYNNKTNKHSRTKKSNPSELLNSQKTKKALVLNFNGGKRNQNNKNYKNNINNKNLNNKNYKNYNINKYFSYDKTENDKQEGGYKKSDDLNKILIKTFKNFEKFKTKYQPKFLKIYGILNDEEESTGIRRINRYVEDILKLEQFRFDINSEKKKTGKLLENVTRLDDIKEIEIKYGQQDNILKFWKSKKDSGDLDKRCVQMQDYIRNKLMKQTSFTSEDELKGKKWLGVKNKSNSIIRNINEYRKIEIKMNKFYKKTQIQFNRFINTIPLDCVELSDYKKKHFDENNSDIINETSTDVKLPIFDFTLCTGYEQIHNKINTNFKSALEKLKKELEEDEKQKEDYYKTKSLQKLIKKGKNNNIEKKSKITKDINIKTEKIKFLEDLFNSIKSDFNNIFKKIIEFTNQNDDMFKDLHNIGIHRYTSIWSKISKKHLKQQIEALSINKNFITTFTEKLKPTKEIADKYFLDKLLDPQDKEFTRELIPKLLKNDTVMSAGDDPKVKYFNINMETIEDPNTFIKKESETSNKYILNNISYGKSKFDTNFDKDTDIICFQNLEIPYDELYLESTMPTTTSGGGMVGVSGMVGGYKEEFIKNLEGIVNKFDLVKNIEPTKLTFTLEQKNFLKDINEIALKLPVSVDATAAKAEAERVAREQQAAEAERVAREQEAAAARKQEAEEKAKEEVLAKAKQEEEEKAKAAAKELADKHKELEILLKQKEKADTEIVKITSLKEKLESMENSVNKKFEEAIAMIEIKNLPESKPLSDNSQTFIDSVIGIVTKKKELKAATEANSVLEKEVNKLTKEVAALESKLKTSPNPSPTLTNTTTKISEIKADYEDKINAVKAEIIIKETKVATIETEQLAKDEEVKELNKEIENAKKALEKAKANTETFKIEESQKSEAEKQAKEKVEELSKKSKLKFSEVKTVNTEFEEAIKTIIIPVNSIPELSDEKKTFITRVGKIVNNDTNELEKANEELKKVRDAVALNAQKYIELARIQANLYKENKKKVETQTELLKELEANKLILTTKKAELEVEKAREVTLEADKNLKLDATELNRKELEEAQKKEEAAKTLLAALGTEAEREEAARVIEAARVETERVARVAKEQAEQLAKEKQDRIVKEAEAKRIEEARIAKEEVDRATEEAAEAAALAEAAKEKAAANATYDNILAAAKAEKAEAVAKAKVEAAQAEADRLAAEEAARLAKEEAEEAARLAQAETARLEKERVAAEQLAKEEAERLEAARLAKEKVDKAIAAAAESAAAAEAARLEEEANATYETILKAAETALSAAGAKLTKLVAKVAEADTVVKSAKATQEKVNKLQSQLAAKAEAAATAAVESADTAKNLAEGAKDLAGDAVTAYGTYVTKLKKLSEAEKETAEKLRSAASVEQEAVDTAVEKVVKAVELADTAKAKAKAKSAEAEAEQLAAQAEADRLAASGAAPRPGAAPAPPPAAPAGPTGASGPGASGPPGAGSSSPPAAPPAPSTRPPGPPPAPSSPAPPARPPISRGLSPAPSSPASSRRSITKKSKPLPPVPSSGSSSGSPAPPSTGSPTTGQTIFKKIAYCICGSGDETNPKPKYNVIYYNTSKFTNLSETISIDQSEYFNLATIPEMDAVHLRSFAAVSIINHNEAFKKKVDNKHKSEIKNVVDTLNTYLTNAIKLLGGIKYDPESEFKLNKTNEEAFKAIYTKIINFKSNYKDIIIDPLKKKEIEDFIDNIINYFKYYLINYIKIKMENVNTFIDTKKTDLDTCNTIDLTDINSAFQKLYENSINEITRRAEVEKWKDDTNIEQLIECETILQKRNIIEEPNTILKFLLEYKLNTIENKELKIKNAEIAGKGEDFIKSITANLTLSPDDLKNINNTILTMYEEMQNAESAAGTPSAGTASGIGTGRVAAATLPLKGPENLISKTTESFDELYDDPTKSFYKFSTPETQKKLNNFKLKSDAFKKAGFFEKDNTEFKKNVSIRINNLAAIINYFEVVSTTILSDPTNKGFIDTFLTSKNNGSIGMKPDATVLTNAETVYFELFKTFVKAAEAATSTTPATSTLSKQAVEIAAIINTYKSLLYLYNWDNIMSIPLKSKKTDLSITLTIFNEIRKEKLVSTPPIPRLTDKLTLEPLFPELQLPSITTLSGGYTSKKSDIDTTIQNKNDLELGLELGLDLGLGLGLGLEGGAVPEDEPETNGFTIVLTNLIGSRKNDIQYMDEIINYTKTMLVIDNDSSLNKHYYVDVKGLRTIQLQTIFNKIQIYTGTKPSVVIGNLGCILSEDIDSTTFNDAVYELFAKIYKTNESKNKKMFPPVKTIDETKKFIHDYYIKNLENDYYLDDDKNYSYNYNIKNNTIITDATFNDIITTNFETNFEKLTEYYIFTNDKTVNTYTHEYGYNLIEKFTKSEDIVGNEAIGTIEKDKSLFRISKKGPSSTTDINLSLLTEKDIKDTFELLDTLLRFFTVGKLSYIKRDLGCFNIDRDDYKLDTNPYGVRMYSKKTVNVSFNKKDKDIESNQKSKQRESNTKLENLYTLNFPTFVETLLNQKTDNFNSTTQSRTENSYYSENQLSYDESTKGMFNQILPIFERYKENKNRDSIIDVYIRLLLVPTNHLKIIAGKALTDGSVMNSIDYIKITKEYATNFYKNSKENLEQRLFDILEKHTYKKSNSNKIIIDNNKLAKPKHLIDLLLETETIIVKGESKTKLIYLKPENKELIYNLYEFINIVLKLRFYDKVIKDLTQLEIKEREEPLIASSAKNLGGGRIERKLLSFVNNHTAKHFTHKYISTNKKSTKKHYKKNKKTTKKHKKLTLKK